MKDKLKKSEEELKILTEQIKTLDNNLAMGNQQRNNLISSALKVESRVETLKELLEEKNIKPVKLKGLKPCKEVKKDGSNTSKNIQ